MKTPRSLAVLAVACAGPAVLAQTSLFDFTPVTALARGAVLGQNVGEPVPGFEMLILKDGRPVYPRAFGRWTIGRVANADSSSKTVSGAVLIALMDERPAAFNLDTRLSEHLPEFTGLKAGITVRQAFSHTGGMRSNSSAEGDETLTLRQAAAQIAGEPMAFVPGTAFSYGGVSMHATGAVAEIVSGESWNSLFERTIAGPLGWTRTRYVLTSPSNPRIAGGCESTAEEFVRLTEMLRAGGVYDGRRVLSEAGAAAMLTRQSPPGVPIANSPLEGVSDYGVGIWLDQRDAEGRLIGAIAGGARGFCSWLDLDDGVTGVVATDLTSFQNIEAWSYLVRAAVEQVVRRPRACAADYNADGFLDFFDYDAFAAAFEAGDQDADFNGDAFLDFFDYDGFVGAYEAGC